MGRRAFDDSRWFASEDGMGPADDCESMRTS